jgi:hypothetical protein
MAISPILLSKIEEITKGKSKLTLKEYESVEKIRADFLPPLYGAVFGDILEHFNIDRNDRKFHDFLEFYVFLDRTEYPTSLFGVRWIRNEKTKNMELFIQLFGHTKKEDVVNNWEFIAKDQQHLPGYMGKSKEWENFDRDMEIYGMYKKLNEDNPGKRQKMSVDKEIYCELVSKYKSLTLASIRNTITKTAKRLGEIRPNG